jgi:thiol-disulfide isomerase/thioredoxin
MNFLKKNSIYFLATLLLLGLFLIPGVKESLKSKLFPMATINEAISISEEDYDIALKGINVPDSNLKNFSKKNLFLNFWGTWCPPCRAEWPSIEALYKSKKGKIDFVLIAMQDQEESVVKFLQENNYTAPVYIAKSPISDKLLPKAFPTTFLLNKKGEIIYKEDASKDWNSKETLQFIDAWLK